MTPFGAQTNFIYRPHEIELPIEKESIFQRIRGANNYIKKRARNSTAALEPVNINERRQYETIERK